MRGVTCVIAMAAALPLAAQAQTISSSPATTATSPATPVTIGKAKCLANNLVRFRIDWSTAASIPSSATGDSVEYWVFKDSASCSNSAAPASGAGTRVAAGALDVTTDSINVDLTTLLQGLENGCANTTATGASPFTTFFCVRRTASSVLGSSFSFASLPVQFAFVPPNTPDAPAVSAGDSHLSVSWTSVAGAINYDVYAVVQGTTPNPDHAAASKVTKTSTDLTQDSDGNSLRNNVTYDVSVRARDAYDNISGISTAFPGTPVPIDDFYARYRQAGGSAEGGTGCASGGADVLALLGAAAAIAFRRRRGAALLAAVLFAAPAARAEIDEWSGQYREPARVLVAVKADRYDPQVDTERGLVGTPYHDIFRGRAPARWQIEADWEVAHPYGAILLGGTVGFWQNYGHGIISNSNPPQTSSDSALLNVFPIGFIATYRFDVLADKYRWLPFIPYAQLGLTAALWASKNGTGDVKTEYGGRGSGWTHGYTTALGVAMSLNAIDPALALEAYNDVGIHRTSLFAEYGWTRLDNFHGHGALILTDRAWRFGMSIEF